MPSSAPDPVTVSRDIPASSTCLGGLSDGDGHVAAGQRDADGTYRYQAYTADGHAEHEFDAPALTPLLPQEHGYHSLTQYPLPPGTGLDHKVISGDGVTTRTTPLAEVDYYGYRSDLSGVPHGGSVAALRSCYMRGNHFCRVTVQRFEPDGTPRARAWAPASVPDSSNPMFGAAAASNRGDTLAIWNRGAFRELAWLTPDGARAGDVFDDDHFVGNPFGSGPDAADVHLRPLLDGSVVLEEDGTWTRVYGYHATSGANAPDWLQSRRGWSFRFTRGNRGYALFPPPGQVVTPCDQRVELLAPSGRLCAAVTLHSGSQTCSTGAADQGWDGTVVQESSACGSDRCTCSYRWWPRLFAGP